MAKRTVHPASRFPALRNYPLDEATADALERILSTPMAEHQDKLFGHLNAGDARNRAQEWQERAEPAPGRRFDAKAAAMARDYRELRETLADGWDAKCIADLEPHQIFAFAETFGVE